MKYYYKNEFIMIMSYLIYCEDKNISNYITIIKYYYKNEFIINIYHDEYNDVIF